MKPLRDRAASRGRGPDSPCRLLRLISGPLSRDAADSAGSRRHQDAQLRHDGMRVQRHNRNRAVSEAAGREKHPGPITVPVPKLKTGVYSGTHGAGSGLVSYPDLTSYCIGESREEASEYRDSGGHLTPDPGLSARTAGLEAVLPASSVAAANAFFNQRVSGDTATPGAGSAVAGNVHHRRRSGVTKSGSPPVPQTVNSRPPLRMR